MGNLNIKADGKGESYSVLAKENRTDDVEGERGKGRKGWQWHNKENGIAKKTRYWVQRSPALSRRWIRYRPSSGTQWMLNLLIVKSHWGIKRTLSSVLVFVLQNKPLSPPFVPPPPSPGHRCTSFPTLCCAQNCSFTLPQAKNTAIQVFISFLLSACVSYFLWWPVGPKCLLSITVCGPFWSFK